MLALDVLQEEGIVPNIFSMAAVTSTEALPDSIIASMILWFIGHGHSGSVVLTPSL